MADSTHIENGETLDELTNIKTIDRDSIFLVVYNGLSYNISLSDLRKAMIGDTAAEYKNELFYSCEEIDRQIEAVRNIVTGGSQLPVDAINERIDTLENDLNQKINKLAQQIDRILSMIS